MDNDFYYGDECFLFEFFCVIFVWWRLYIWKYYRVWNIVSYIGIKELGREKFFGIL